MVKTTSILAVLGVLLAVTASAVSAAAPQRWVVETEQAGINPCTGEGILLQMEVLFSTKANRQTTVTHARLLASTGEQDTKLASLHVVENKNGVRATIREIHSAPDGSKFSVTIVNVERSGGSPEFSFDARCIRGPAT